MMGKYLASLITVQVSLVQRLVAGALLVQSEIGFSLANLGVAARVLLRSR